MIETRFREYQIDDPDASVLGRVMVGILNSLEHEAVLQVLNTYHLATVDPDSWYPMQMWGRVLRALTPQCEMVHLGRTLITHLPLPAEVKRLSLPDALYRFDDLYHKTHQGSVGHFDVQMLNERHALLEANVPYPDDMIYGMLWQLCQRCLPPATPFNVSYDRRTPPRKQGGQVTRLHVRW